MPELDGVRIGVLALQGSFREHLECLARVGAAAVEVRRSEHLAGLAGLVIPGGESTTLALVAERWGLVRSQPARSNDSPAQRVRRFPLCASLPRAGGQSGAPALASSFLPTRRWVRRGRRHPQTAPLTRLCRLAGQKQGGQLLIGGLDVVVSRNFFGSQVDSFETELLAPPCLTALGGPPTFRAVFIRAPAILSCGADVEVLAEYEVPAGRVAEDGVTRVVVAARHGKLLGTAFHPEVDEDLRWHRLFVQMCTA